MPMVSRKDWIVEMQRNRNAARPSVKNIPQIIKI